MTSRSAGTLVSAAAACVRALLVGGLIVSTAAAQFDLLTWTPQDHGEGSVYLTSELMVLNGGFTTPAGSTQGYTAHAPIAAHVSVDMDFKVGEFNGSSEPLLQLGSVFTPLSDDAYSEYKPVVFDVPAGTDFGFALLQLQTTYGGLATFTGFAFTPVPMTVTGPTAGDGLGTSLANVGDVNDDGIADLAAGMPSHSATGPDAGGVVVLSGADGSVLHELLGDAAGDRLGASVGAAGDVDGDSVPDFIAGAPGNSAAGLHAGLARVYSGADGHTLRTFLGGAAGDELGTAVSGASDVNGDGRADVIVGAQHADPGGTDSGAACVFSGADGSLLHTFVGLAHALAGKAVAGIDDVNGDGRGDLAVGFPGEGSGFGAARVFSGSDGALLDTLAYGSSTFSKFGSSLAAASDIDGDGIGDFIVGETGGSGKVRVFSGATGAVLLFLKPTYTWDFGASVANAGDVNGDGVGDILVGEPDVTFTGDEKMGHVFVYSGRDGSLLWQLAGASNHDAFGTAVAGVGDRDGDGVAEIAIGVPGLDGTGNDVGGVVFQDFFVSWFDLGQGMAGTHGIPALQGQGLLLPQTPIAVMLSGALEFSQAALVIGFSHLAAPFKGGVLLPTPDLVMSGLATKGSGGFTLASTWPAGVPSGFELFVQAWIPDPAAAQGLSASNGLRAKTP
jgi:hypothetical protein